jgi:hypothetical protein
VAYFYVIGVQADDHGNTIQQATELAANNVDVPGRIEAAGDVDVFAITAAQSGKLVIRVSDLAFGMSPRLRIVAADGTTELANVTVSGEAYLWTEITLQEGETIYAEVTHRDAAADHGTYAISAGHPLAGEFGTTSTVQIYLPIIQR